eukprot:3850293-Rhodomonas_salina.1
MIRNAAVSGPALVAWLIRDTTSSLSFVSGCAARETHQHSSCRACWRLFSRIQGNCKTTYPVDHRFHATTNHTVSDAVRNSLELVGISAKGFSGISMRCGGLTTALTGNVQSDLYKMQSGHASDAWKKYVRPGQ